MKIHEVHTVGISANSKLLNKLCQNHLQSHDFCLMLSTNIEDELAHDRIFNPLLNTCQVQLHSTKKVVIFISRYSNISSKCSFKVINFMLLQMHL